MGSRGPLYCLTLCPVKRAQLPTEPPYLIHPADLPVQTYEQNILLPKLLKKTRL